MATQTELSVPLWTPPTFCAGKVPLVTPALSRGQEIEGDFPLDQIVLDRKCRLCYISTAWNIIQS